MRIRKILAPRLHNTRRPLYDFLSMKHAQASLVSKRDNHVYNLTWQQLNSMACLRFQMIGLSQIFEWSLKYAGKAVDGVEGLIEERIQEGLNYINWLGTTNFDRACDSRDFTQDIISRLYFGRNVRLGFLCSENAPMIWEVNVS